MEKYIATKISVSMEGAGFNISDFKACKAHNAFCTLTFGENGAGSILFHGLSASTLKHMIATADVEVVEAKD
jgi:hypothetical protein